MADASGDRRQDGPSEPGATPSLRLDKWLWFARFFKSRTLASEFCAAGRIRIAHKVITKAHHPVRPGDVLTFPLGGRVRVIRIAALASRRGSAPLARALYEDLTAPQPETKKTALVAQREKGAGRPTKADRRAIARLMQRS